jgi:restriction system protein
MSAPSFERLVVELLLRMGYGGPHGASGLVTGGSGDGGVDGLISEDKLGLDVIYIQAKRWQGQVGAQEVRSFVGALATRGAQKGVFITTSGFTKEARQVVEQLRERKVVLIDGKTLVQLMIDHNVGVYPVQSYEVKHIDSDYFSEG